MTFFQNCENVTRKTYLVHYNGTGLEHVFTFDKSTSIMDAELYGDDIALLCYSWDDDYSIIMRGYR